jgi:hypothetical protein
VLGAYVPRDEHCGAEWQAEAQRYFETQRALEEHRLYGRELSETERGNAQAINPMQLEEPIADAREIWQRCLDRAIAEGASPKRIAFYKSGLSRHDGLTDFLEEW